MECPICGKFFPFARIEAHAQSCVDEKPRKPPSPPKVVQEPEDQPCPLCGRLFTQKRIASHAATCDGQLRTIFSFSFIPSTKILF